MREQITGINPRLRRGEVLPIAPSEKVVTRLHGQLVFVSERKEGEEYVGKSGYTSRQREELAEMLRLGVVKPKTKILYEKGGAW